MIQQLRLLLGCAVLSLAAGCAVRQPAPAETEAAPPKVVTEDEPAPAETKRDGKYYKDDGPPDFDEVDWRTVPDPEVTFAPINPRLNRAYEVFGVRYVPFRDYVSYRKRGDASWYGRRYHGRQTSSGEIYDMYRMTAAHTVLPIPSYARVTRVDDGRSIIVRVNDRGPFLQERIIDLSYTAARKLGVVEDGTAEVIVEALVPTGDIHDQAVAELADENGPLDESTRHLKTESGNFLQIGAFADIGNADNFALSVDLPVTMTISSLHVFSATDNLHRVVIGPYPTKFQAEQDLDRLHAAGLEALLKIFE